MFLYTSVPIVHIFSAERVQHRLHTVAVLSCPVVAMLLHCALDLLQCVKTEILQLDFHCLQVDEDRARQIW